MPSLIHVDTDYPARLAALLRRVLEERGEAVISFGIEKDSTSPTTELLSRCG